MTIIFPALCDQCVPCSALPFKSCRWRWRRQGQWLNDTVWHVNLSWSTWLVEYAGSCLVFLTTQVTGWQWHEIWMQGNNCLSLITYLFEGNFETTEIWEGKTSYSSFFTNWERLFIFTIKFTRMSSFISRWVIHSELKPWLWDKRTAMVSGNVDVVVFQQITCLPFFHFNISRYYWYPSHGISLWIGPPLLLRFHFS